MSCFSDFFTNLGKEDEEIWQPAKDKYLRCVRSNSRMEKLCNLGKVSECWGAEATWRLVVRSWRERWGLWAISNLLPKILISTFILNLGFHGSRTGCFGTKRELTVPVLNKTKTFFFLPCQHSCVTSSFHQALWNDSAKVLYRKLSLIQAIQICKLLGLLSYI